MIMRWLKWSAALAGGLLVLGMVVFGTDLPSYITSSTRQVRTAVKESVPVEFELQRARDLLETMLPEIQAKIRLIAHEEVEVAALQQDIARSQKQVLAQAQRVRQLRDTLQSAEVQTAQVSYAVSGQPLTRPQAMERLSREFGQCQESENLLASKQQLLQIREQSLRSALESLESVRSRKALLEQKIESLAAQHRLLKARAANTSLDVDPGQLARADQLLNQLQKRLEVATRVLQHEMELLPADEPEALDADELLSEVDRYLSPTTGASALEVAAVNEALSQGQD